VVQCTALNISTKLEKIPILSKFIGNSMLKFGLGDYGQFQVQLAVEEAVTNIIKHGSLEVNDKISIKCQKRDNEIHIIIEDPGKPFNQKDVCEPDLKISPLKRDPGGLGIYFIKKYMDKINYTYKDGKNILTLIKYIK
jgi:serine/threonine-protein kinase RsbW